MRGFLVGMSGLVILGAALAAANFRRVGEGISLDWRVVPPVAKEIVLEAPRREAIIETITATGTLEPVEEADIAPQIVGRVVEVLVEDGDRVKKGDVLLLLDETEARARLDSAKARIDRLGAAIHQAKANLEKAQRDVERTERLAARNASTPTEMLDMRSALDVSRASLQMASGELAESEAMRQMSEQELSYTRIVAPIDGVVSGCDVEVGEVVIAGTTNLPGSTLMSIANLERMQVRAEVDETDVPLVAPGQTSRVYLQADLLRAIPGTVRKVAPKGVQEGEVVTFETLIGVESSAGLALRSGMTATVEVEVRRSDEALSVPVQAVVQRRRKDLPDRPEVRAWAERNPLAPGERAREAETRYIKIVFLEQGGKAVARPVDIGLSDERRVEIKAGLGPDDRVVVGPFRSLDELKDGDPVKPLSPAEAPGEGS